MAVHPIRFTCSKAGLGGLKIWHAASLWQFRRSPPAGFHSTLCLSTPHKPRRIKLNHLLRLVLLKLALSTVPSSLTHPLVQGWQKNSLTACTPPDCTYQFLRSFVSSCEFREVFCLLRIIIARFTRSVSRTTSASCQTCATDYSVDLLSSRPHS